MRPRTSGISGDARPETIVQKFQPKSEWKHSESSSYLLVYLPGFIMEQLTITPDISNGTVKIEGQRRLPNGKLLPMNETFSIPEECELAKMVKEFGRGTLMLKMPRNVVLPPPETKKETAEEESRTSPENSRSQEDEKTDPPRETSIAGIVTPAVEGVSTKLVDENRAMMVASSDQEKLLERKAQNNANGEAYKAGNPTEKLVPKSGVKEGEIKAQNKGSTMPSATAAAKLEDEETQNRNSEERKLIINVGAAVLIIMGVGVSLFYTLS